MHRRAAKPAAVLATAKATAGWTRARCLQEMQKLSHFKRKLKDQHTASQALVSNTIQLLEEMADSGADVGAETYAEAMKVALVHDRQDAVERIYERMQRDFVAPTERVHVLRLQMMARDKKRCYEREIGHTLNAIAALNAGRQRGACGGEGPAVAGGGNESNGPAAVTTTTTTTADGFKQWVSRPATADPRRKASGCGLAEGAGARGSAAPVAFKSGVYHALLLYHANRNDRDASVRVLGEMHARKVPYDVESWRLVVMTVPRSHNELAGVLRSCKRAERQVPDVVYIAAIQKVRKLTPVRHDMALSIHEKIQRPTTRSFNELLFTTTTPRETTRVLEMMTKHPTVEPNPTTYDIMIRVCAGKSLALAKRAFEAARARGVVDSRFMFSSMMRAYALARAQYPHDKDVARGALALRDLALQERAVTRQFQVHFNEFAAVGEPAPPPPPRNDTRSGTRHGSFSKPTQPDVSSGSGAASTAGA